MCISEITNSWRANCWNLLCWLWVKTQSIALPKPLMDLGDAQCNFTLPRNFLVWVRDISSYCRSRITSDMTCKLRRVKRFLRGKIQPESLPMSEMVLAFGSSPEKAGQTRRKLLIEDFAVYKQPTTYCKRQLSLPATSTQTHEQWSRRKKSSKWVQTWHVLAAKQLNFERALDKCGHTAHYKELPETANRASKVSGIQVRDWY